MKFCCSAYKCSDRRFCCINTGAIVEHDCKIGKNVFIQPEVYWQVMLKLEKHVLVGASIRDG